MQNSMIRRFLITIRIDQHFSKLSSFYTLSLHLKDVELGFFTILGIRLAVLT